MEGWTDSSHEDANLICRLYEMRREETMRQARAWPAEFFPEVRGRVPRVVSGRFPGERLGADGHQLLGDGGFVCDQRGSE